jgi:hypothetical protein
LRILRTDSSDVILLAFIGFAVGPITDSFTLAYLTIVVATILPVTLPVAKTLWMVSGDDDEPNELGTYYG